MGRFKFLPTLVILKLLVFFLLLSSISSAQEMFQIKQPQLKNLQIKKSSPLQLSKHLTQERRKELLLKLAEPDPHCLAGRDYYLEAQAAYQAQYAACKALDRIRQDEAEAYAIYQAMNSLEARMSAQCTSKVEQEAQRFHAKWQAFQNDYATKYTTCYPSDGMALEDAATFINQVIDSVCGACDGRWPKVEDGVECS